MSECCYETLPRWTATTIPTNYQHQFKLDIETWGQLTVLQGRLKVVTYHSQTQAYQAVVYGAGDVIPFLQPQVWYQLAAATNDLTCQMALYCRESHYVMKRYGLSPTHSEVVEAAARVAPCRVLDLGCGGGRNALYLARKGYQVTAVDQNKLALERLSALSRLEALQLELATYDINQAALVGAYDWIISTVVLMFLQRDCIPAVIKNMQAATAPGGYHLIVCAMHTAAYPCPLPFTFTFSEGELASYYQDWELIKYNEHVGELHKRDAQGKRYRLQFATLLARKPQS